MYEICLETVLVMKCRFWECRISLQDLVHFQIFVESLPMKMGCLLKFWQTIPDLSFFPHRVLPVLCLWGVERLSCMLLGSWYIQKEVPGLWKTAEKASVVFFFPKFYLPCPWLEHIPEFFRSQLSSCACIFPLSLLRYRQSLLFY